MSSLHSSERSPRAHARAQEPRPLNGRRPLVELRLDRRWPWWRQWRRVFVTVVGCLLGVDLVIILDMFADRRPSLTTYLTQWVLIGLLLVVTCSGRPCGCCGRWGRHALTCTRRRR